MKNQGALAVIALVLICLPVVALRAQPAAEQQLQNTQQSQQQNAFSSLVSDTTAPELYPGENSDIGPQRILKMAARPTPWELYLDTQFFYTNNATFISNQKIGSGVFVNTVQVSYSPGPYKLGPGTFAPSAGIASQWYNYGRQSLAALSFDAQTAFLDGKYNLGTHWQVLGGINYTRLLKPTYIESYREFLPNLGVQYVYSLRDNLVLIAGDQVAYHYTYVPPAFFGGPATNINDRLDETVNVAIAWQLTGHLIFQPYYRFQYSYYPTDTLQTSSREDYLQTGGLTLAYYFNKAASARVFFNYNDKKSTDTFVQDYQESDGGLGASVDVKF
jgi:hypothetical protein